jgi:hypothetical protein
LELLSSLTDKAIWIIFNSMTVDEGGREIRRSLATDYSKKNLLHGRVYLLSSGRDHASVNLGQARWL